MRAIDRLLDYGSRESERAEHEAVVVFELEVGEWINHYSTIDLKICQ